MCVLEYVFDTSILSYIHQSVIQILTYKIGNHHGQIRVFCPCVRVKTCVLPVRACNTYVNICPWAHWYTIRVIARVVLQIVYTRDWYTTVECMHVSHTQSIRLNRHDSVIWYQVICFYSPRISHKHPRWGLIEILSSTILDSWLTFKSQRML